MMKKKKQSISQSSTKQDDPKKTPEPSSDSSPSPRLLSIFRSKLTSGKDMKHMFRGMRSKTVPGLSSQSRIVRCPKCHKLLQEPIDATSYKCSGCNSILQAKSWELEGNSNSIPEALLSSHLSTEEESAEGGSKTPMRSTHKEYNSRASPSVERSYHSETVYKHERSDIRREWMRKADEFSVTGDSDVFASARSSPLYNSRSNASEWSQHEGRYEEPPRDHFYPASPSLSSVYEYGYSSPFHESHVSASEHSYYHHQPNKFNQYGREGWFQDSSFALPVRFPSEASDGKYYHWSSQSQLHDLEYHNLYESSSFATPHRSLYSEVSYQAAAEPHRSTSSEKSSLREKKRYVRERNPVKKRHVLPSAGGAPLATCSYCLELLQLPQVSLLGKHKRYQVRCGSCSGVLKFSIPEKADTVLESPSFVDSETGFADETLTSQHTEALQPQLKPSVNHWLREQQPASSSETIGETSRIHQMKSENGHPEKSIEMDNNIFERLGFGLEENETLKPKEMVGEGSGESLEVPVYKNEMMNESSEESERDGERPIFHSVEPLYKKEYICETRVVSENTRDTHEFDWEETQENKEYGGQSTWEEIMGDKPGLNMEKSLYIGDSICNISSSYGEIFEDTTVKEDTEHISNTFSDAMSVTPKSPLKSLVNENQRFIGHSDQSGETKVTISRIHEEQSKYEYENLSGRQEFDKTISDRVRYEVSLGTASKTFKTIIEGETGEERSVLHQMDPQNETVANSYGTLEPVYLEGSGYAGERTWEETMEYRVGLHLEEFESNYENYSKPLEWSSERAPTFSMYEYELGTILEPDEDADGGSESSSRGSFSDHESSEESVVSNKSQDAKPEKYEYENENSSEKQELSNTISGIVRPDLHDCGYKTNEALEPVKMVGVRSVVTPEKASETIMGETAEERSVSHQMSPQNKSIENSYRTVEPVYLERIGYGTETTSANTMGDGTGLQLEKYQSNPFEWTSERAPTFRLHEYELGTMLETDEDADRISESNSRSFFNNHESLKLRAVFHEEELQLVNDNRTDALQRGQMVEDESMKLDETFEWTSGRALTFRVHEYEAGTMLEPDEDADGRSESSSRGSFNDHGSSKERVMNHEEELLLVNDHETEALKVEDGHALRLEKGENEKMELYKANEPRGDMFRLSPDDTLEQERMMFHLEMFQDKQENLKQIFKHDEAEEDIPAFGSRVSSKDHETSNKMAKADSEAEEEMLGDDLEHLTSEPYEIVGLRHALYQTQSSHLTSPIHTPIGSPLHYMMGTQIRSPIASPMHSHIVSPLRSPINTSGSLSDVLFFHKKG